MAYILLCLYVATYLLIYEPWHGKINSVAYAPQEFSDQSGYPPKPIRVISVGIVLA